MDKVESGSPAVVGANWYRFRPGEHIYHAHVASVSFVWVVQGFGTITSCGRTFPMTSGSIVRLPWRHDVDYRADARSPFHVGTLHLVPWHASSVSITPRVAHHARDKLLMAEYRRDSSRSARSEAPVHLSTLSATGRNVIALASYCVERYLTAPFSEEGLRAAGVLIDDESHSWVGDRVAGNGSTPTMPAALEWMLNHIAADITRPISVAAVAEVGGCSRATAERLFARYTGLSVHAWVRARRMEEAARLFRTSGLRVNEVARLVGFSDPLYFSRVFAATYSTPPSRYAKGQLRP